MQLFILSTDPVEAASYLDDKRVVKMVTETAQIISSALWLTGSVGFYRLTHQHHPVVQWAAADQTNLAWTVEYFKAISEEYTKRYERIHKCASFLPLLSNYLGTNPVPTKFCNLAGNRELGLDYTAVENTVVAYQLYLNDRWDTDKRQPTINGRAL